MTLKVLEVDQAIIIMGYTGVTTVPFFIFAEDVERRLGRPIFTHQYPSLAEEIKAAYKDDFLRLTGVKDD